MKHALAVFSVLLFAACAPVQERGTVEDPLEPLNRQVFAFNEVVDMVVFEPVARTYRFLVPQEGRKAVRNAYRNLQEPVTMANALLQLDGERFFTSFWRFVLNSTFGFGGLYDFAGTYGNLPHRQEDFGQTLAVWANDTDSAYLVLPFLGPSTTRDAFGRVVDIFLDPWTYPLEDEENIALAVGNAISQREALLDPIENVYDTSFDPYATFRSAYQQRRKAEILNRHSGQSRSGDLY